MPAGNYLTDEDVAVIQAMIDKTLLGIQNQGGNSDQGPPLRMGQVTYLAKLKGGVTIPAVDIVSDPPIISSGECSIFVINDDDEIIPVQFRGANLFHNVFNMTAEALTDEDIFFLITQDKFGKLFYVAGGASCECEPRNEKWQINVIGDPTGGTFSLTFDVGGVGDTVVIDWDSNAADAQTAFEGHSEIGSGQVEVTGGPLPDTNLSVEFKGTLAETPIDVPTINKSALTGAAGAALGIIITEPVPGYGGPP